MLFCSGAIPACGGSGVSLPFALFQVAPGCNQHSNTYVGFGKYLSFGLIMGIIIQMILNICVVIGIVPVTGVTLPFISYGGSSLVISMISIGIILNVGESK